MTHCDSCEINQFNLDYTDAGVSRRRVADCEDGHGWRRTNDRTGSNRRGTLNVTGVIIIIIIVDVEELTDADLEHGVSNTQRKQKPSTRLIRLNT